MHVYIVLCIISYIHVCCRVYRKMAMSEKDILVIILICIQNYTCINYTVFFRFLSSELTYDNYCMCHSLINCIYQDILLLTIFFSVTSRAIAVLEMAGRQVAKCDQKSFWATSCGQKYVYLSPEELCLGDQL